MRTTDGYSISKESARHKFGGDPMAEYLYGLGVAGGVPDDEATHPSDGVTEGTQRFGRRILSWDDLGFVYHHKCATVADAEAWMADQHSYYDGLDDDYDEETGDFIATITGEEATVTDL